MNVVGSATSKQTFSAGKRDEVVGRVQFLDMLRGLAITFVVFAHYYHGIFPGASIGVSVFFVISGYLITAHLVRNDGVISIVDVIRFWVRRIMRVYPAFVVSVLAIGFALSRSQSPLCREYFDTLWRTLTFTGGPSQWIGFSVGVWWTLYIEFWFYMTVPLLVIVTRSKRRLRLALIAVGVLSALTLFNVTIGGHGFGRFTSLLPGNAFSWMCLLILGAILATLDADAGTISIERRRTVSWACFLGLLVICLFVSNDERTIVWPTEAAIASLITAVWIYTWNKNPNDLSSNPITFMGKISYSLYLVHGMFLDWQAHIRIPSWGFLSLSRSWCLILLAVGTAYVMHLVIELPGIRVGKMLTGPRGMGRLSRLFSPRQ